MFDKIAAHSYNLATHGRRAQTTEGNASSYLHLGYRVPNQWQGTFDDTLKVTCLLTSNRRKLNFYKVHYLLKLLDDFNFRQKKLPEKKTTVQHCPHLTYPLRALLRIRPKF